MGMRTIGAMDAVIIDPERDSADSFREGDVLYVLDVDDRGDFPLKDEKDVHCRVLNASYGMDVSEMNTGAMLMPPEEEASEYYRSIGWDHAIMELHGSVRAEWAVVEIAAPHGMMPDRRRLDEWMQGAVYRVDAYRRHEWTDRDGRVLTTWEHAGGVRGLHPSDRDWHRFAREPDA